MQQETRGKWGKFKSTPTISDSFSPTSPYRTFSGGAPFTVTSKVIWKDADPFNQEAWIASSAI
jgi:hypothetical protein